MRGLIAIVLSVLFVGIAYSTEHPNLKTAEPKNSTEAEQRGSDKNPLTIKVLPAPDADAKARQEEKYRNEKTIQDEKLTNATVWLARITVALALFTGGLWYATFRLANDAKKTASQQAKDTQDSLVIARDAAKAAIQNATATMATERAYVFVNVKITDEKLIAPVPVGFVANFCNHGKTPAVITYISSFIEVVSTIPNVMPENRVNTGQPIYKELPEGLVIASELIYEVTIKRYVDSYASGDIEEVIGGRKFLVCCGLIRYKDIFDIKRETGFCWQYSPQHIRFIYSESSLNYYK